MSIRKLSVVLLALAATTSLFAAEDDVSGQGKGAVGWTPVQVGLFSPVSYPWECDWDLKGVGINFFYMENVKLQGLAVSGIATRTRDDVKGVVLTGLCNWNETDVYGINATLGANIEFANVYGVELGLFSMRQEMQGLDINLMGSHQRSYTGVQVAGLCNFTLEDFTGGDIAFGLNMANDVKGFQAGGINFAHQLKGVQLGFFNIAEKCPSGIQIGLVNIIMDNIVKVLPITNFYF